MPPRIGELFGEVADLPPEQRQAYYTGHGIPDDVREEVESLLAFDGGEPIQGAVHRAIELAFQETASGGERCGPFRLIRQIGSGGMGVVYLAERAGGEVRQQVAIKLLRSSFDSAAARQRFLQERQILATLDHPNIARLIDAGRRDDGVPYLAMEFVDGKPIDEFGRDLPPRSKAALIAAVCDAMAAAHQKLVVHRDLKPGNILVDAAGNPRVLDFGIAKLIDDSDETATVERRLTPQYASPEQFTGAPVTTATDIYSLGAVLYLLLAGSPPARHAPAPPCRAGGFSSADLDAIVLKALRPDPAERYSTADKFAEDLRAWIERRPVAARRGEKWYLARRRLRRYWVPVTAAALVLVSLSVGLFLADRERRKAEQRFNQARQLALRLFDVDAQVAQLPGGSRTRQLIVDTALEYLRNLTADVRIEPDLALELGTAHMRVARVQGVNISTNLGQTEPADQTARQAEALIDSVLAVQPENRTARLRAGQVAHDRMILAGERRQEDAALRFADKAAGHIERYLRPGMPSDRNDAQQAIIVLINVANRYMLEARNGDALSTAGRAIEVARATGWPSQAGASLMIVALAHRAEGDLDRALAAIRDSVRQLEASLTGPGISRRLTYSLALTREAQILGEAGAISLGRSAEAVATFRRALAIPEDVARRDPTDFLSQNRVYGIKTRMAAILRDRDPAEAVALYDDALGRLRNLTQSASTQRNEVTALAASVGPLLRLGRRNECRTRIEQAFERLGRMGEYPARTVELGSAADVALRARAAFEASSSPDAGAARYRELLRLTGAGAPKLESRLNVALEFSELCREAAPVLRRAGAGAEAELLQARRLDVWKRWNARLPENAFVKRQLQAARLD